MNINPFVPRLYCLPKLHKYLIPDRPVVSSFSAPCYLPMAYQLGGRVGGAVAPSPFQTQGGGGGGRVRDGFCPPPYSLGFLLSLGRASE